MPLKGFAHLHLHSQYSLLDGAIKYKPLFERCKEFGMDSVACTDHGNMFGVIEFYTAARDAGVKPIIGTEAYVAPNSRFERQKDENNEASYHLVLLAQNQIGYRNLLKLSSAGFTEGFYYKPRVDKELLEQFHEGIIATSACVGGEIPNFLLKNDTKNAQKCAENYAKIFGSDNFYIEIQHHEDDSTNRVRPALIDLANKVGLGLVATNDVHFLDKDDYEAHNCLCCIGTSKNWDDPNRLIYPRGLYFKSPDQMRSLFPGDAEQACDNTVAIAARCNVEIDLKSRHAPIFKTDDGTTPEEKLRQLVYEGAAKRYPEITDEVRARIEREIEVIAGKGFASYFLINWEFCLWAHKQHIPVGARGSGVGTIVGYCLGLCNVDPLKYDLLFERFMDPHRNEMPDIDIDMCQANRQRLIEYVRNKYGHVAQIITFGTLKARAAIRDICRVMNIPLSDADKLSKLIPETLGMTLDKALETEPELKRKYDEDPVVQKAIDIGRKLEGLARHSGIHAAGIVIAQEPLENYCPLYKASGTEDIVTQLEGPMVEKVGLLKMDFLGLKTLSVLERTRQLVFKNHGVDLDLDEIDITDPKVFEVFSSGRTKGVFQFESGGMADLLMKMKPDRLEDLIAANALYRPGPMTLIPDYIERKHGGSWSVPHPIMEEILRETFGIMIYQEQVMRIANRLGDIPLREAYTLIKAIGKKKLDTIAAAREQFVTGCLEKGLKKEQAEEIFELIERFAGYGFNKSHSTRYAFIAYQTAFLKAYYPVEFWAALLTFDGGNTEKLVDYINECQKSGLEVLPPEINESDVDFTPIYTGENGERKGVIRFGLGAIKGVGEKAVEQIIDSRNKIGRFKSLFHFCENVETRAANKQVSEALIKAGCFDRLGGNRAQMMAGLETAMQSGQNLAQDRASGQMSIFSLTQEEDYGTDHDKLPQVPPWPEQVMLAFEKEVLGFYVTSNPLSHCAETIDAYSSANTAELYECHQDKEVVLGGMISKIRTVVTKNGRNAGKKMAILQIDDLQGSTEIVLFPKELEANSQHVVQDKVLFVRGKVDRKRETPNIFAEELIPIEEITTRLGACVKVRLFANEITNELLASIRTLCEQHKGRSQLSVTINTPKGRVYASADRNLSVNPDVDFCKKLKRIVGNDNLVLTR